MANAPNVMAGLEQAANKQGGGFIVLNFTAIVSRLSQIDMATFVQKQLPVMKAYADMTADISDAKEFHQFYRDNAIGMERYLERG